VVSFRTAESSESRRPTRRRANPAGLGRLLCMTATVGLLSLGQGILWWVGLLLLGLILVAVGRQGQTIWGTLALLAVLMALAFWHLHLIPMWTGLTFAILGAVQFAASLLTTP